MTRLLCLVGLAFIGLTIPGCEPGGKGQIPIIRNGETFNRVLAEAEEHSREILERYDRDEELTDADRKELEEAKLKFEGLIGFQPEGFALHFGMAKVLQGLDEHDTAVQGFERAIALAPPQGSEDVRRTVAEAYGQIARSSIFLARYSEASEAAKRALAMYPRNPDYLSYLASAAMQLGDLKFARETLDKALRIDPTHERSRRLRRFLDMRA
ncbi:MAG: tetratricopeptide repeat protein [Fimbriimonadaceae bacterium]|nr:tetratricopeptide repeat protein [Fimbriimonadaceae bacterium]